VCPRPSGEIAHALTVLNDGADRPRTLGEAASIGPTHHVLDWLHLSMRIQRAARFEMRRNLPRVLDGFDAIQALSGQTLPG
jgi:hypothetical protein